MLPGIEWCDTFVREFFVFFFGHEVFFLKAQALELLFEMKMLLEAWRAANFWVSFHFISMITYKWCCEFLPDEDSHEFISEKFQDCYVLTSLRRLEANKKHAEFLKCEAYLQSEESTPSTFTKFSLRKWLCDCVSCVLGSLRQFFTEQGDRSCLCT